jgi:long-chain acyl-CoA synthetase
MTLKRPEITGDDVAFLQYTGGTTGVSKGATLLHRNVVANIMQCEAWFKPMLDKVGDKPADHRLRAAAVSHLRADHLRMMGAHFGGMNLLIPNPRDIPGFVRTLAKHKINMFPAVNTLFNALANNRIFARLDFSGLVVSNGGGMAVQQATAEKWLKVTGLPGRGRLRPVGDLAGGHQQPAGPAGVHRHHRPAGAVSTEIADPRRRRQRPAAGHAGEICIRGPQVMAGYWNRPDETAKVMTPTASSRPATSASWTSAATCASSTARRT